MDYRTKEPATIENDLVLSAPTIILFMFNFSFIKARDYHSVEYISGVARCSHVKSVTDLDLKDIREPGRNRISPNCLSNIANFYCCGILPLLCSPGYFVSVAFHSIPPPFQEAGKGCDRTLFKTLPSNHGFRPSRDMRAITSSVQAPRPYSL